MKKFLKFSEKYFAIYLLFLSISSAVSTILSKGSPAIFFSPVWLAVSVVSVIYLTVFVISKFVWKKYLEGLFSILIFTLLFFYYLNTLSLKFEYVSVKNFNASEKGLLEKNEVMLLEHGFGDTGKLKNYERAIFLVNGKKIITELNHPVKLKGNRKILLTGDGQRFLITKSDYLAEITVTAFAIIILMACIIRKKWNRQC